MSKKHSKRSASGSERWLHCPASIKHCENIPPEPDSKYSKEGTFAHAKLEEMLLTAILGFEITSIKFPSISMARAVKMAFDYVKKKSDGLKKKVEVEKRISLDHIGPDMFGTCDVVLFDESGAGTLYIYDYKHGSGIPVDVRDPSNNGRYGHNTQLVYYALGEAHARNYDFSHVVLGIIQPRAFHHKGPIREESLSVEMLWDYADLFKKGIERTLVAQPKYSSGKWCRWCPGKNTCREYKRTSNSEAARAFNDDL